MFTNLGSIYGTNKPREAESTDTRLGIRRHEPDQERRKKKRQDTDPEALFNTDDSATVSVNALYVFLDNFLKSIEKPEETRNNPAPAEAQTADEKPAAAEQARPEKAAGPAAQAAGAYQSTARSMEKSTAMPQNNDADAGLLLGAEDVRTIHTLMDDLKILSERGVEYLQIERSASFLGSLVTAAQKALNPAQKT